MLTLIMLFGLMKEVFQSQIPIRFPSGANKVNVGYFKILPVRDIYGDMIKLNDGRVLIYRVTGTDTYIFDPKTDSFKRTAITNGPSFYEDSSNKYRYLNTTPNTQYGVNLPNGKVLIIPPTLKKVMGELEYYRQNREEIKDLGLRKFLDTASTEINEEELVINIRKNDSELYQKYLKYKEYEKFTDHAHLYNPETEKMETISKPPFEISYRTYKIPLDNGNILLVNLYNAAIYDYRDNTFTLLPKNHKLIGYDNYAKLSNGNIFMLKKGYPYVYNIKTDTITKKDSELGFYISSSYVQTKDDKFIFLNTINPSSIYCAYDDMDLLQYDVNSDKLIKYPIFLNFADRSQVLQKISDEKVLIYGKDTEYNNYTHGIYQQPCYWVEVYDCNKNSSGINSKKTHYTYSHFYGSQILLDDGRVLMQYKDHYELFIPKSYKKQKKAEQKQLKKQQNKK